MGMNLRRYGPEESHSERNDGGISWMSNLGIPASIVEKLEFSAGITDDNDFIRIPPSVLLFKDTVLSR